MATSFRWKRRFGRFEWEALAALTRSCAISASGCAPRKRPQERNDAGSTAAIGDRGGEPVLQHRTHGSRPASGLICSYIGWPVCHVYLRSKNAPDALNSATIWQVDDVGRFAAFREVTDRSGAAAGTGLPGCILASGKPQWIVNLADEEPLSERTRTGGGGRTAVGIRVPDSGGREDHGHSGVLFAADGTAR